MWEEVSEISNEPGQLVTVEATRELINRFGPNAGKTFHIPVTFVGVSYCNVEAEKYVKGETAVTWRFINPHTSGGDDLSQSPAFDERVIELDPDVENVIKLVSKKYGNAFVKCRWLKWKRSPVTEVS